MFYPLPTSLQLAQHEAWLEDALKEPSHPVADQSARIRLHDAWLEETRKEPLHWVDKPARIRVHRRLLSRVGKWLVSAGLRLQARYRTEAPRVPKASPSPTAG
jgi:hypothetical protein